LADIYLELRPAIRRDEMRQLRDTIPEIGNEDRLIIKVERSDAHQADEVFDLLDDIRVRLPTKRGRGGLQHNRLAKRNRTRGMMRIKPCESMQGFFVSLIRPWMWEPILS